MAFHTLKWAQLPSYLADGTAWQSPDFIFELRMAKKQSFQALWPLNWELVGKELGTFQGPPPSTSTELFLAPGFATGKKGQSHLF